jgi:uncharacterized protein
MKKILFFIMIIMCCVQPVLGSELEDIFKNAEQGNASSQLQLGFLYSVGRGVNQNYKEAVYWFKKAANQESPFAQVSLGALYSTGNGVDKNYKQAVYWYTMAATQGNKDAQYYLANNYEKGLGISQDYKQAIYWYTKAAKQGEIKAQANLGGLLAFGPETLRDVKKAVYWCKRSAEQGDVIGQFCLGALYEFGIEFSQDYQLAYVWANLAGAQGYKAAIKKRDIYAQKLSPEDLLEAQKLSVEIQYKIDHPDENLKVAGYEPMIYDDGWKALSDTELTKRMHKPVTNINTDKPFNFKVLDKNGIEAGIVNTPVEYFEHMRKGNSFDIMTTYDIINDGLFRRVAIPLLYFSKAKKSKYSYVRDFSFDDIDPLLFLPVSFISWHGSDQEEVIEKASLENKSWRSLSPKARILSSAPNNLSVYDTFAEDMYKLSGEDLYTGNYPSHVINQIVLGDLNNDGYEDLVIFYAYYYVGGSGRYYLFKVLTRESKDCILKDITDDVDKLIWKE